MNRMIIIVMTGAVLASCSTQPKMDKFSATTECRKLVRAEIGDDGADFPKTVRSGKSPTFEIDGSVTSNGKKRTYFCKVKAAGSKWKLVSLDVGDPS